MMNGLCSAQEIVHNEIRARHLHDDDVIIENTSDKHVGEHTEEGFRSQRKEGRD